MRLFQGKVISLHMSQFQVSIIPGGRNSGLAFTQEYQNPVSLSADISRSKA
jgi:hypothetical protein